MTKVLILPLLSTFMLELLSEGELHGVDAGMPEFDGFEEPASLCDPSMLGRDLIRRTYGLFGG